MPNAATQATNSNSQTVTPTSRKDNSVLASLQQQMHQELNEGLGKDATIKEGTKAILSQKYGLSDPQLVVEELQGIRREEKINARFRAA